MTSWSFLTNYARVLTCISRRPDSTGLEIAQAVGITERAVRTIVADLQAAGYIASERIGRRNRYRIDPQRPLDRIGEHELTVGEFLELLSGEPPATPPQTGEHHDDSGISGLEAPCYPGRAQQRDS